MSGYQKQCLVLVHRLKHIMRLCTGYTILDADCAKKDIQPPSIVDVGNPLADDMNNGDEGWGDRPTAVLLEASYTGPACGGRVVQMSNSNTNSNVESNPSVSTNSQTSSQNSLQVSTGGNNNGGNNRNGNGGNNSLRSRNVQPPFTPPSNVNQGVQFGTNPPFPASNETSRSVGSSTSGVSIQTVRNLIYESQLDLVNLLTQHLTSILNPMMADTNSKYEQLANRIERISQLVDEDDVNDHAKTHRNVRVVHRNENADRVLQEV
ncbi:hypothetical protein PIB30_036834 [Stylosanthes scabra]|uniref:Uncharacterized protein n=1 Tax=Stylosanthes scabra TaxID=79078 RepID=A0ABU6SE02_9FABA|nr:hypothetical protein [Stylosanthes scabra]